jgi:transposase-like protein
MSLIARPAPPMSKPRRPGPPSGEGAATPQDHLRALLYRTHYRMSMQETARLFGVHPVTIWRWTNRALRYPEAKQVLASGEMKDTD